MQTAPETTPVTEPKKEKKKKTVGQEILSWILSLAIALAAAMLIRTFLFTLITVKGSSMEDTLLRLGEGSRLVGIVSHVAELRDRIGRQIIVKNLPEGGSAARLVIEE